MQFFSFRLMNYLVTLNGVLLGCLQNVLMAVDRSHKTMKIMHYYKFSSCEKFSVAIDKDKILTSMSAFCKMVSVIVGRSFPNKRIAFSNLLYVPFSGLICRNGH